MERRARKISASFVADNPLFRQGYRQFADNLRQTGIAIPTGAVHSEEDHTL